MTVNDLKDRVRLEQKLITPDGGGGHNESWSFVNEYWASVRPASGRELTSGGRIASEIIYRVIMRRPVGLLVSNADRLIWRGHVLNVRAVLDGPARDYLEIFCEAGAPV